MPRICIVQPKVDAVSETFIRAHGELLPGVTTVLNTKKGLPHRGEVRFSARHAPSLALWQIMHSLRARQSGTRSDIVWESAVRTAGADVVLAEYGPTGVLVHRACARAGVPLVVHFHGYDAWIHDLVERHRADYIELFRSASAVVSGCESMSSRLADLGAPLSKIVTNYVSTVQSGFFEEIDCSRNPPRFVAVGRFVEKKAPHLTLLAFAEMSRQCPAATLTFIGTGPLLAPCRQLAVALRLTDRVQFLGAARSDDVRRELRLARAFVQHSVEAPDGDREGTGISVLEAAMSGLAICATRHEGIAETMIQGTTALLVGEYCIAEMASAMLRLATDGDMAGRLGRCAAKHAQTHFTMERSIDRLSRVLQTVADHGDVESIGQLVRAEWSTSKAFMS